MDSKPFASRSAIVQHWPKYEPSKDHLVIRNNLNSAENNLTQVRKKAIKNKYGKHHFVMFYRTCTLLIIKVVASIAEFIRSLKLHIYITY